MRRTRKANLRKLTATGTVERRTPLDLFDWLARQFGPFDLDVAATDENALCSRFYTRRDNGLAQPWHGRAFMNPPFGETIGSWVGRARQSVATGEADLVACVLPARVDAAWWHEHVQGAGQFDARVEQRSGVSLGHRLSAFWFVTYPPAGVPVLTLVHFLPERVKFDGLKSGAPFPTAIVVFGRQSARALSVPDGERANLGAVWEANR